MYEVLPRVHARLREIVMPDRSRVFGRQILVELSACRHSQQLRTSANGEDWLPVVHRPPGELDLGAVAVRVRTPQCARPGFVVSIWIDVHAAREEDAVEL